SISGSGANFESKLTRIYLRWAGVHKFPHNPIPPHGASPQWPTDAANFDLQLIIVQCMRLRAWLRFFVHVRKSSSFTH
ncbi:hypothetical protein NFI96_029973, partial [Prochilodus magdalenae]